MSLPVLDNCDGDAWNVEALNKMLDKASYLLRERVDGRACNFVYCTFYPGSHNFLGVESRKEPVRRLLTD